MSITKEEITPEQKNYGKHLIIFFTLYGIAVMFFMVYSITDFWYFITLVVISVVFFTTLLKSSKQDDFKRSALIARGFNIYMISQVFLFFLIPIAFGMLNEQIITYYYLLAFVILYFTFLKWEESKKNYEDATSSSKKQSRALKETRETEKESSQVTKDVHDAKPIEQFFTGPPILFYLLIFEITAGILIKNVLMPLLQVNLSIQHTPMDILVIVIVYLSDEYIHRGILQESIQQIFPRGKTIFLTILANVSFLIFTINDSNFMFSIIWFLFLITLISLLSLFKHYLGMNKILIAKIALVGMYLYIVS